MPSDLLDISIASNNSIEFYGLSWTIIVWGQVAGGLSPFLRSLVPAILDLTALVPAKDNPVRINNDEAAGNEARVLKFLFGDLAFALECRQVGPPGGRTGWDVIVARNFDGFHHVTALRHANDFIEVAWIMANPFTV